MKSFDRILTAMVITILLLFLGLNAALSKVERDDGNKTYKVEISRLCRQLENGEIPALSSCSYVTGIEKNTGTGNFFDSPGNHIFREIGGTIFRFDYLSEEVRFHRIRTLVNVSFLSLSVLSLGILLYLRQQLVKPFHRLTNIPYELSKGNLTAPLSENRNRFFGRFVWGIDMLRETMESQRQRELALQKEKQTLLLSISHDIKTPLSAIKLYASALTKGLYKDVGKQRQVAASINGKVDEIEQFVSQLSQAASKDFLQLEVSLSEFYLSEMIKSISSYYSDKLALNQTEFVIEPFTDCILTGEIDRSIEVLQNIMENAIKYGDGRKISISFSSEEDGRLVTVANSGTTLPESELIHIFDSFWRGSNSSGKNGSGLGLYISRQLMLKMGGEIFAERKGNDFSVTAVFRMA